MVNILILSFLLAATPAQRPQNPAVNPADQCTVQGVVIKAGTGEPLRKAIVEIWNERGSRQGNDMMTDAMGRFELRNLDPGRYRLSVERNGYVRQQYGQTKPEGSGSVLTLSPGQKISDITFQLIPAAVITGHVYDENGEPVQGAQVAAVRYSYMSGQRELAHAGQAQTNDLGEYRIFGLAPGQYFVQASNQVHRYPVIKAEQGYVPIYYPGVPDAERAAPIALRAGDEFPSVDITLQTTHTVTLRGRVVGDPNGDPLRAQIFLVSQGATTAGNHMSSQSFVNDPHGGFEMRSVVPGTYFLYAVMNGEGGVRMARQPIEVADSDIDGISLIPTRGVDVKGRLHIEGNPDSSVGSFHIFLSPKRTGTFFYGVPDDNVKPDGTFLLKNTFDDLYDVNISGLPENYFLKSARLDGVDVLATGVTIDSRQTPTLLDLLVSPNGGRVDGVVSSDHQPFQGASVTLVPDPPHRGEKRLFQSATTDQLGHFVLQGIPPGDYKLFAWESIENGAYTNSDFLQPFETRGESVHVAEGGSLSITLDLIPAKDTGR